MSFSFRLWGREKDGEMGSFAAQDLGSLGKTALNVSLRVLKSALFFGLV